MSEENMYSIVCQNVILWHTFHIYVGYSIVWHTLL